MLPIRKIICPTDFSQFSFEALDKASELAHHFEAQLCVLHVTPALETLYSLAAYPGTIPCDISTESLREGAECELTRILERKNYQSLKIKPLVREGDPVDEIVNAAKEEQAGLIVIPTHGLSGWRHLLFGSVTEKVIRLAPCPVLVTHSQQPIEES